MFINEIKTHLVITDALTMTLKFKVASDMLTILTYFRVTNHSPQKSAD